MTPWKDPQNEDRFRFPVLETRCFISLESDEVVTTWKWWNYSEATAPPGKQLLTINLDETYVGYYQGLFKRNLGVSKKTWPIIQKPLSQPASRSQLRMGLTHVGLLWDVPSAQRLPPQMLIASEKVSTTSRWSFVAIASSEMFLHYL